MSNLQIFLRYNEKLIGTASNIKIVGVTKKQQSIKLLNFTIISTISIKKNELLEIEVVFKNTVYSRLEFRVFRNLEVGPITSLTGYSDLSFYSQDVVDIFFAWGNKTKLNWRNLTIKKKKGWLVACLYWSGVPKSIKQEINFTLDCLKVGSSTDFYCLLGETFVGERGYFGQNLDGLEDCISAIQIDKSSSPSIVFENFDRLKIILDKKMAKYTETVIEIFQSHGFNTIIK